MAKELKAIQKFLRGMAALPNFSALKAKHLKQFEAALAKISSLQVGQGAELIEEMDSAVWSEEELQQIKLWISEKMDDNTGNVSSRPLQDFFELPRYLTLQWWNFLQTTESQLERVEQLTRLCGALGLRCPSERTVAVLVGLSCCIFRAQGLSDAQKYQFLQEYKPKIKKMLSGLPKPVQYLTTLPSDTTQLPVALRENAFPAGFVPQAPEGVDLQAFGIAMVKCPLRKTNSLTQEPKSFSTMSTAGGMGEDSAWRAVGHILAAMMGHRDPPHESAREARPRQQIERPVLALRDGTVEPLETNNRDAQPLDTVRLEVAEALPERCQVHEETDMDAELKQLRMQVSGQDPAADSESPCVMKRPYTRKAPKAKSVAKTMKRPAGSSESFWFG